MNNHPVVVFDGVCNLCNASVDLILRIDRRGILRFASLQSKFGQNLQKMSSDDSIILFDSGNIYTESSAILRITKYLGGIWPLAQIFLIIPPLMRNWIYRIVARNRYRWFGRRQTCRVPNANEKSRFLKDD